MRRSVLVSLVFVVAVVSVTLALVVERTVLAEPGSVAAVTVRSAGVQEAVKVVGSTDFTTITTLGSWSPVTSASITIPAGHTDLLTVDLFAESLCTNPD